MRRRELALTAASLLALLSASGPGSAARAAEVFVEPVDVVIADVNRDGRLDIITADERPGGVSVLLGQGGGRFGKPARYDSGGSSQSIVAGDFNRDGTPDVAVSHADVDTGAGGRVSVLAGRGNGTLGPPTTYPVGAAPFALAVGDLNGDGALDLATANNDTEDVSVLLGSGNGDFAPERSFAVGEAPFDIALADLNGDGHDDVVTPGWTGDGIASVLLETGPGLALSRTDFPAGVREPAAVASGDFDGDARPDLVLGSYVGNISLLRGVGGGRFGTPSVARTGVGVAELTPADLNGDGKLDVAAAHVADVLVLLGNGDGSLRAPVGYKAGTNATSVAVADLNGDGAPDLAVSNFASGDVSVLLNRGNGSFRAAVSHPLSSLRPCTVPKVVGKTLAAAKRALVRASCALGRVTRRHAAARKGRIVAQSRPPGTILPYGVRISVVVSRGPG